MDAEGTRRVIETKTKLEDYRGSTEKGASSESVSEEKTTRNSSPSAASSGSFASLSKVYNSTQEEEISRKEESCRHVT